MIKAAAITYASRHESRRRNRAARCSTRARTSAPNDGPADKRPAPERHGGVHRELHARPSLSIGPHGIEGVRGHGPSKNRSRSERSAEERRLSRALGGHPVFSRTRCSDIAARADAAGGTALIGCRGSRREAWYRTRVCGYSHRSARASAPGASPTFSGRMLATVPASGACRTPVGANSRWMPRGECRAADRTVASGRRGARCRSVRRCRRRWRRARRW